MHILQNLFIDPPMFKVKSWFFLQLKFNQVAFPSTSIILGDFVYFTWYYCLAGSGWGPGGSPGEPTSRDPHMYFEKRGTGLVTRYLFAYRMENYILELSPKLCGPLAIEALSGQWGPLDYQLSGLAPP